VTYTGPDALIAQMRLDVDQTREVLSTEQRLSR